MKDKVVFVGALTPSSVCGLESHPFCAFVDIRKTLDTSEVEATLVRLCQAGVPGRMWRTMANFLCGTLSQVRIGSDLPHPWVDTGNAHGRVLSTMLSYLLFNSLLTAIRRAGLGLDFPLLHPTVS